MDDGVEQVARMVGLPESVIRREFWRARRRSEPDAREVYGVLAGRRFVARRGTSEGSGWHVALESRPTAWLQRR